MGYDAIYKSLFNHRRVFADLLRGFIPTRLTGTIDFDTLQPVPTEYASGRPLQSDMVWRVRVRKGGLEGWYYVLVEFQSTSDWKMALRMLRYAGDMLDKLSNNFPKRSGWKLPRILPVVIYNGRSPWLAPEGMGDLSVEVDEDLLPYEPRQNFFLIDIGKVGVNDALLDNVLYAEALIEQGRWDELLSALPKLDKVIDPDAEADLRCLIAELVRQAAAGGGQATDGEALAKLKAYQRKGELGAMGSLLAKRMDEAIEERSAKAMAKGRTEGMAQGMAEGMAEGMAQGMARGMARGKEHQRAMLSRLAARKFDADTATRLGALLAAVDDPDGLAAIGDCLIDCEDGDELLSRVAGVAKQH